MKTLTIAGLMAASLLLSSCGDSGPSASEKFARYKDPVECLYDFGYYADNFEVFALFFTSNADVQVENRRNALILCRDFLTVKGDRYVH